MTKQCPMCKSSLRYKIKHDNDLGYDAELWICKKVRDAIWETIKELEGFGMDESQHKGLHMLAKKLTELK